MAPFALAALEANNVDFFAAPHAGGADSSSSKVGRCRPNPVFAHTE